MLGNATGMVLDCRHGRVLLHRNEHTADDKLLWSLVVWDPVTGGHHPIPVTSFSYQIFTGAVVCDVPKCKHRHCHDPFVVVFVACDEDDDGLNTDWVTVYSSSTGEWSRPLCLEVDGDFRSHPLVEMRPPLLIHGSLYFTWDEDERVGVLKFSLENDEFSLIHPPPPVANEDEGYDSALMVTSLDGGFGYATVDENRLLIWSWKDDGNDPPEWSLCKEINMDLIIPSMPPSLTGSIEGTSSLFLGSADRLFTFDFNTLEIKEVGKKCNQVTPFIRYITPMSDVQESDTEDVQGSNIDNAPPDQAYLVPALPCLSLFWGDKKGTDVSTHTAKQASRATADKSDKTPENDKKSKENDEICERVESGSKVSCQDSENYAIRHSQAALVATKKGSDNAVISVKVDDEKMELGTITSSGTDQSTDCEDKTDYSEEKQAPTPKKPEVVGKKRAIEGVTPAGEKAKVEPSGDKKGTDVSTHAAKLASRTTADKSDKTPEIDKKSKENDETGEGVELGSKVTCQDSENYAVHHSESALVAVKVDDNKLEVGTLTSSGADLAEDSEDETDYLEEQTTTPKKPEVVGEKRASEARIPSGKKAKVETFDQKTGDKKGVHVSNPYPTKQASKTPADQCDKTPDKSNEKSPKSGSHACKSCSKTFGSQSKLESHIKEKHQA